VLRERLERFWEIALVLLLDAMIALLMVGLIRASEELTPHIFTGGVEPNVFGHGLHTIWGYGKVVVFLGWLVISTIKFFWLPMMGVALSISGDTASVSGDTALLTTSKVKRLLGLSAGAQIAFLVVGMTAAIVFANVGHPIVTVSQPIVTLSMPKLEAPKMGPSPGQIPMVFPSDWATPRQQQQAQDVVRGWESIPSIATLPDPNGATTEASGPSREKRIKKEAQRAKPDKRLDLAVDPRGGGATGYEASPRASTTASSPATASAPDEPQLLPPPPRLPSGMTGTGR
jgi:hypothetical protein